MALNTLFAFIALNTICYLALLLQTQIHQRPVGSLVYGDQLAAVYPGWSATDRTQLLTETWSRSFECVPFVHFQEAPHTGQYVNVDSAGFRWNSNTPPVFPPGDETFTIFVFGGSTTFGYGVADHETIPAYLETLLNQRTILPVRVLNFGVGNYYSEQELRRFEGLLLAGYRPDLAIFIDGINELQPAPRQWQQSCDQPDRLTLPMLKWIHYNLPASIPAQGSANIAAQDYLTRWQTTRGMIEAIAAQYTIKTLFIWQPSPYYRYNLDYHLFAAHMPDYGDSVTAFYTLAETMPESANYRYLGHIQEHATSALYVDAIHYTAAFNYEMAQHIAEKITKEQLIN